MENSNSRSFLPGLSHSEIIQLRIFLAVFFVSAVALTGNWLGISYVLNSAGLLMICFFTFAIPPSAKGFYLFSYALLISSVLDLFIIGFNWEEYDENHPDYLFILSFLVALFFVFFKVYLFLHQLEIAKILNGEQSPVNISSVINTDALRQQWEQHSTTLRQHCQQQSVVLREQCHKKSASIQEQCQLTLNRLKNRATATINQAKAGTSSAYQSDVENPMLTTNITRIYHEPAQVQPPVYKKPMSRECAPSPKIERRQPIYMNKTLGGEKPADAGFSQSE